MNLDRMKRNLIVSLLTVVFGFNIPIWFFFWPKCRTVDTQSIFKCKTKNYKDLDGGQNQKQNKYKVNNKTKQNVATRIMYPRPWRVLDIQIQYIINNDICGQVEAKLEPEAEPEVENKNPISIVNLVHTHAAHFQRRETIRDSFTEEDLKTVGMRRVFLLANPDKTQFHQGNLDQINSKMNNSASNETNVEFWSKLTAENVLHSDLVMGDFIENYRNMTYKHLMGLDWALKFCPQATFIIKQDDDTAVDFYQIKNLLDFARKSNENSKLASSVSPEKMDLALRLREKLSTPSKSKLFDTGEKEKDRRFFMGVNWSTMKPQRKNSKWAVTNEEYEGDIYPNFILGFFYLSTMESARDILKASRLPSVRFFWIDDVFVTGILRERAGIEIVSADEFGSWISEELDQCLLGSRVGAVGTREEIPEEQTEEKEGGGENSLKSKSELEKGSWCKRIAVVLNLQRLYFLKAFHQQEKLLYLSHRMDNVLSI